MLFSQIVILEGSYVGITTFRSIVRYKIDFTNLCVDSYNRYYWLYTNDTLDINTAIMVISLF